MSVSFSLVPGNAIASGVFVEQEYKRAGVAGPIPQRVALLGQYNTGKTPTNNVAQNITSADEAASLYGIGSMLHRMAKKFFAAIGAGTVQIDAFPLAAGIGAATGGTILVAGPASSAGTISLYIAGEKVQVVVASGDAATAIATAIGSAINAKTDLPVTAGVISATVTLTPRWVGLSANGITIRQDLGAGESSNEPTGVTLTITALAGGSANPSIATALTNFGDTFYTWVVTPYNDDTSLDLLEAEGVLRVGPSIKRPFAGVTGYTDTRANYSTWLASRNSPWTTSVAIEGSPNLPGEISASTVGACSVSAQTNPARPFKNLPIVGILPGTGANWTYAQKDAIESEGGSPTYLAADGQVYIADLLTTYVTNPLGAVDESWRYTVTITNVQAKIYSLDQLFNFSPFDRAIVVDDDAVTSLEYAVSPKVVKSYIINLIDQQWIPSAWSKNRDDIVAAIVCEINLTNPGRIDVLVPDIIAVGLRIMAVKYQWSFAAAA